MSVFRSFFFRRRAKADIKESSIVLRMRMQWDDRRKRRERARSREEARKKQKRTSDLSRGRETDLVAIGRIKDGVNILRNIEQACAQRDCIDLRERRRRSSHFEERATEDPSRVAEADVDAGNGSDAQTRVGRDPPEVHVDRTHGPLAAVVERERQLGDVTTGLHKHRA